MKMGILTKELFHPLRCRPVESHVKNGQNKYPIRIRTPNLVIIITADRLILKITQTHGVLQLIQMFDGKIANARNRQQRLHQQLQL